MKTKNKSIFHTFDDFADKNSLNFVSIFFVLIKGKMLNNRYTEHNYILKKGMKKYKWLTQTTKINEQMNLKYSKKRKYTRLFKVAFPVLKN